MMVDIDCELYLDFRDVKIWKSLSDHINYCKIKEGIIRITYKDSFHLTDWNHVPYVPLNV